MVRYKQHRLGVNVEVPASTRARQRRRIRLLEAARQERQSRLQILRIEQEANNAAGEVVATENITYAHPEPQAINDLQNQQVPLEADEPVTGISDSGCSDTATSNQTSEAEKQTSACLDTTSLRSRSEPSFRIDVEDQYREPLCPCTDVSTNDLTLMVIAIGMRHKLSWVAQLDILKMIHTIFPDRSDIPLTRYMLFQRTNSDKVDVNYHIYCKKCKMYLGDKSELVQNMQCEFCKKILDVNKAENYFCSFSIINQCRDLFEGPDDMGSIVLSHRANRQKQKEEALEDIYDGSEYKKYCQPGNILSYSENFSYNFFTDGVPVGKSGKSIWPIYISINELPEKLRSKYIILAGLYIGPSDPNINEFMTPFVNEANKLSSDGFQWSRDGVKITSKAIPMCGIVDSVARSMLLNMQSFHAYSGCTFCYKKQEPTTSNKNLKFVIHQEEEIISRTRESLEADIKQAALRIDLPDEKKRHYKGVKGPSCLMDLNFFDPCRGVVVDYMHSVLLGVVKTHMTLLFSNDFKKYWNVNQKKHSRDDIVKMVDRRLLQIKPPKSVTRTPESFKKLGGQKASQWRAFVVFYCIVCLQGLLKEDYLKHLALLSTAMNILLQKSITESQVHEAHALLISYQVLFQQYFGAEHMYYNVHLLSHLCMGVLRFGPIWGHNAFPFEGQNRYILQMCTSPFSVVKQVSRRYLLNRSFPRLCVTMSSGDRAIDFSEDTLERRLKCFVYNAECVLVGKGKAALLTDEEAVCVTHYLEQSSINLSDSKKTQTFKSMIVKGFRVSVRAGELLSRTRNINSYVNVTEIGFACVEKIIFYTSKKKVFVLVRPVTSKNNPLVTQKIGNMCTALEHVKEVEPQVGGVLKCVSASDIICQCVFINLAVDMTRKQYICEMPYGCYKD